VTGHISVLVADDHSLVRAGFRSILGDEEDIDVVGDAKDGAEAVEAVVRERPDVVLMDIRMPGMDGLEATRRITADPIGRTKVIVLTTFDLDEYVFGALKAGASGFLLKGVEPQALIDAVRTVAGGDALLEPGVTRRLIEAYVKAQEKPSPPAAPGFALPSSLTAREAEILRLIAAGLTNGEIAERLFISPLTCKSHVSRILTKLEARDRIQLVVLAYESGLIVPGQASDPPGLAPAG
jgi:DNA-binding NarL/FixJ family response regulator